MELTRINVIDDYKLLPNHTILLEAIRNHPLNSNIIDSISSVIIIVDKAESIEYDFETCHVTLHLSSNSYKEDNFKYILYHEFTHIADKINPLFKYSEELKESLTDTEKLIIMEVWNCYIDARLNMHGLFQLGDVDRHIRSLVNGKVQTLPFSTEGKLMKHTNFIKSRGFRNAEELITNIWAGLLPNLTYPEIVKLVKANCG